MSTPITPDAATPLAAQSYDALSPDALSEQCIVPSSSEEPVFTGVLTEECVTLDAVSQLPGPPQPWRTIEAHTAIPKLNWTALYPRLDEVAEGAVIMAPTTLSGWVKIVKGPSPVTSAFFVQVDEMRAEPGSVEYQYKIPRPPAEHPLDRVHFVLDIIGLAPVLGGPADGVNSALYFVEGDVANASLSMLGILPFGGEAATLSKWSVRYGDDLVDFGSRRFLREAMNLTADYEAHHIIPWELRFHEIVQAAGRAGFDLNDSLNGFILNKYSKELESKLAQAGGAALDKVVQVTIPNGVHGNHPAYNFYILKFLEEFTNKLGGMENISPQAARDLLEATIIPALADDLAVCISRNLHINNFFKERLVAMKWFDTYKDYASNPRFYSFIHGTDELLNDINILW